MRAVASARKMTGGTSRFFFSAGSPQHAELSAFPSLLGLIAQSRAQRVGTRWAPNGRFGVRGERGPADLQRTSTMGKAAVVRRLTLCTCCCGAAAWHLFGWLSRHDGRRTGRPGATTPGLHPIRTTIRWERRRREWFGGVSERVVGGPGAGLSLGFFFWRPGPLAVLRHARAPAGSPGSPR